MKLELIDDELVKVEQFDDNQMEVEPVGIGQTKVEPTEGAQAQFMTKSALQHVPTFYEHIRAARTYTGPAIRSPGYRESEALSQQLLPWVRR